jgi:hypothetical protein
MTTVQLQTVYVAAVPSKRIATLYTLIGHDRDGREYTHSRRDSYERTVRLLQNVVGNSNRINPEYWECRVPYGCAAHEEAFGGDQFLEDQEYEGNARYDYVREAYAATARDLGD